MRSIGGLNMKLCFSTLGCPEWSFSDIISTACDMGYDGIEIRGVGNVIDGRVFRNFHLRTRRKRRRCSQRRGLRSLALHPHVI